MLQALQGVGTYIVPFVVVLTIVVFVHELGHFLVGRWCGIKVDAFSIGFGPELFAFTDGKGTRWRFAALPLGGYVKFHGDANGASMADDDPEGWHYYEKTFNYADGDPDIFLLSNQQGVGNVEVSAFQAMADVVLQKSLREGFGLTVTEAMWKRKPVVAGAVGGILLQVDDGVNGFLIDDIGEAAEKVSMLLDSPATAQRMGEAGHDQVRRNFLSTRPLLDYLSFFHILLRN